MKPSKNKIFCHACNHTKILFATKKEAIRFLKFNADEIEQETSVRPVRAYFCKACGGWHVTSKPQSSDYNALVKRFGETKGTMIFNGINALKGHRQGIKDGLLHKIRNLRHLMKFQSIDIDRCNTLINELMADFEMVITNKLEEASSVRKLFQKFSQLCSLFLKKKQFQMQRA